MCCLVCWRTIMVKSGPTKHIHAYILNTWLDVSCTGLDYKVFALIRHLLTRSLKFVYYILFLFNFVNLCFLFTFVCFCFLLFVFFLCKGWGTINLLRCWNAMRWESRLLRQAKCLYFLTLYCSIFVPPSFFNPLPPSLPHSSAYTLSSCFDSLFLARPKE